MAAIRRHSIRCTLAVIATAFAAIPAAAQATISPARRCERPDTTASWYRRQQEWWRLDLAHDWTSDSVRTALIHGARALEVPATGPFPLQLGAMLDGPGSRPVLSPADSTEVAGLRQLLRDLLKRRIWPNRSLVGPAGVRATWLIIRGDSALTSVGMHRMMEAGPGEVSGFDVAVLEDWLRLETGRKQLNATQFHAGHAANGTSAQITALPTEDFAHVELRRDAAGLPPIPYALCVVTKPGL